MSTSGSRPPRPQCFLCGSSCDLRRRCCPACQTVMSCHRQHMTHHRRGDYCFPYKVLWTDPTSSSSSVRVVATRDIGPLELILLDDSVVVGPAPGLNTYDKCAHCGNKTSSDGKEQIKCSCGLLLCSSQCQSSRQHQMECRLLQKIPPEDLLQVNPHQLLTSLRLLRIRAASAKVANVLDVLLERSLELNRHFALDSPEWSRTKTAIVEALSKIMDPYVTAPEISWSVSVLRTHSVSSEEGHVSFFPLFSLLRHSCLANCKFTVQRGRSLAVLAKTHIARGQEITVSWAPVMEPTWKRRIILYRDHLLWCRCPRCLDPAELGSFLSALRCSKCPDDSVAPRGCLLPTDPIDPDSDWTCASVHKAIAMPAEAARQLALDLQTYLTTVSSAVGLESALDMFRSFLTPNHGLIMAVKRALLQSYSKQTTSEAAKRAKSLADAQLELCGRIDPGWPDWRGHVLRLWSTAELNLTRIELQSGLIERPEFLQRVRVAVVKAQEASMCQSAIRVHRHITAHMPVDQMMDEMSNDSSYMSDASN